MRETLQSSKVPDSHSPQKLNMFRFTTNTNRGGDRVSSDVANYKTFDSTHRGVFPRSQHPKLANSNLGVWWVPWTAVCELNKEIPWVGFLYYYSVHLTDVLRASQLAAADYNKLHKLIISLIYTNDFSLRLCNSFVNVHKGITFSFFLHDFETPIYSGVRE